MGDFEEWLKIFVFFNFNFIILWGMGEQQVQVHLTR